MKTFPLKKTETEKSKKEKDSFIELIRQEKKLLNLIYKYISEKIKVLRSSSNLKNRDLTPEERTRIKNEIEMLRLFERILKQSYKEERTNDLGANLVSLDQIVGFCLAKALKLTENKPIYTTETISMNCGIQEFLVSVFYNELQNRQKYKIDFSISQAYDAWKDSWNSFQTMEKKVVKAISPKSYF